MSHTEASKRHDFVFFFDVKNGNPNGDPDASNMPRINPQTNHGLVTDVALKRKVRDYAALYRDQAIFIQSQFALNKLITDAFRAIGVQAPQTQVSEDVATWFEEHEPEDFDLDGSTLTYTGEDFKRERIREALTRAVNEAGEQDTQVRRSITGLATTLAATAQKKIGDKERLTAREQLCRDYFDIRMFGAVLATGLNAGQVRGPAQFMFAQSIDPIFQFDPSITRNAITRQVDRKRKETEMARKPLVPYGLYRMHGFFNPRLGKTTGITDNDLSVLWDALCNMFEVDRSAARGEMTARGVYIFTHENELGNAHAHRLFSRIRVTRTGNGDSPFSFEDYTIKADDTDLPSGITLTRLEC